MPVLGDTISTASVALADLSDVATTSDVQIAHLGVGVAEGATARITLPATASLAGGIDFGGTASLQYVSAGKVKFERPSGGSSTFEVNAATGQNSILDFSENGIAEWRFYHESSVGRLTLRDTGGSGRDMLYAYPEGYLWVRAVPDSAAVGSGAIHAFRLDSGTGTMDGRGDQGTPASDGLNRDNYRLYFQPAASRYVNSTNGTRGDSSTSDTVLTGGHSGFVDITDVRTVDAKGAHLAVQASYTITKPTGTTAGTDSYQETVPFISRIENTTNRGTYVGNWESYLKITATGDGGPVRGFGSLIHIEEDNLYATYSAANLGAASTYISTGFRGLRINSSGDGYLGTGIMLGGAGGSSETAPPSGYKRAIVLKDRAAADIFCVDGAGNIGVRYTTDQTTTIPAALTVGYTAAFAASTVAADGINFGGDVTLYRISANNLKTDDNFTAVAGINVTNAINNNATAGTGMYQFLTQTSAVAASTTASAIRMYTRNGFLVFVINDAGTTRYLKVPVTTAASATDPAVWSWNTTAP